MPSDAKKPRRAGLFFEWDRQLALVTSAACGPFCPCTTSNSTLSPSARDLNPEPLIALKWTKTSGPPSREMKPNPLASLNHLTVPVMRAIELILFPRRAICKAFYHRLATAQESHLASPDIRPRDAHPSGRRQRRASFVQ